MDGLSRDVMTDDNIDIPEIEQKLLKYRRWKGLLGELVEGFVFGLDVDNRGEADFVIAGIELKTNPLKNHSTKTYVSKEGLIFLMINYDEVVKEDWKVISFLKKEYNF